MTEWRDSERAIYTALQKEFEDDLPKWNAFFDEATLTFRFLSPEVLFKKSPVVLFKKGKSDLEPYFEELLSDFMPRYIRLLNKNFSREIKEVRIEGHTSSEWANGTGETEEFIRNMKLSQERTRAVLNFSMRIPRLLPFNAWMRQTVSANGLSSARLILDNNIENEERSRRVEFTIRTKTKEALSRILDKVAPEIEKKI